MSWSSLERTGKCIGKEGGTRNRGFDQGEHH